MARGLSLCKNTTHGCRPICSPPASSMLINRCFVSRNRAASFGGLQGVAWHGPGERERERRQREGAEADGGCDVVP